MQILPGIHRIDRILGVNCYLIQQQDEFLLVDTGYPADAPKVIRYLNKLGCPPDALKYILATHGDIDHIGAAAALKKLCGCHILIHTADSPILEGRQDFKTMDNFLGPSIRWLFNLTHYQPTSADIIIKNNTEFHGWRIIPTPGHTAGSVCFYKPGQVLIVGDALRTSFRARPRPISRRICLDLKEVRCSLLKICELDYEVLLPGHGAPIMHNASNIIRKMMQRYPEEFFDRRKIFGLY
jgi:hydroxyacylglutathione hydrolase